MKVTNKSMQEFQPFTLEFLIETEEEARAMFAIFNHVDNLELFKNKIYSDTFLPTKYGSVGDDGVISNGVTYNKFYSLDR